MTRTKKQSTEAAVREIRRRTRRKFSPEEKIRIVLEGLRGEQGISELCRREGIASNLYYRRIGQTSCVPAQRPGMNVMVSPFGDGTSGHILYRSPNTSFTHFRFR